LSAESTYSNINLGLLWNFSFYFWFVRFKERWCFSEADINEEDGDYGLFEEVWLADDDEDEYKMSEEIDSEDSAEDERIVKRKKRGTLKNCKHKCRLCLYVVYCIL
jgi:hypothetical protein